MRVVFLVSTACGNAGNRWIKKCEWVSEYCVIFYFLFVLFLDLLSNQKSIPLHLAQMDHASATPPLPMRVWLLSFPLPGPGISLSFLHSMCGFRLDECYSTADRRHVHILLYFAPNAGVSRTEMERLVCHMVRLGRRYTARCVAGHCPKDVRAHPGFRLMRSRMLDGDPRLRFWRAAHSIGLGLLGVRPRPVSLRRSSIFGPKLRNAIYAVARRRLSVQCIQCGVVVLKRGKRQGSGMRGKPEAKMLKVWPKPPPSPSILAAIVKARPFTPPQARMRVAAAAARLRPPSRVQPTPQHYQYVERPNDCKWTSGWAG